jgi:dTDP-4-dehydrorhamnose reductase
MSKKIVLFGSSGVLGREITSQKTSNKFISPSHSLVDITNFQRTYDFIKRENPDEILHLAAIVGARECEENKEKAYLTNALGTENISKACLEKNIKLIYMSTDTVFDGEKGNYSEEDLPNPINYYSFTKFAGECFVKMVPSHLIIRSSFLPRDNFPYSKAFTDQYTTRITADILARDIMLAIDKNLEGIIHMGGEKDTLYNLAKKISPSVGKLTREETGLRLPKDLSLDTSKWRGIKNELGYI